MVLNLGKHYKGEWKTTRINLFTKPVTTTAFMYWALTWSQALFSKHKSSQQAYEAVTGFLPIGQMRKLRHREAICPDSEPGMGHSRIHALTRCARPLSSLIIEHLLCARPSLRLDSWRQKPLSTTGCTKGQAKMPGVAHFHLWGCRHHHPHHRRRELFQGQVQQEAF